jgi:hypothetical protein
MIKEQSAQAGKFLASASSSRTAMQTTGNHVSMTRVLSTQRGIHGHDSAVQIADAQHNLLKECRVI